MGRILYILDILDILDIIYSRYYIFQRRRKRKADDELWEEQGRRVWE